HLVGRSGAGPVEAVVGIEEGTVYVAPVAVELEAGQQLLAAVGLVLTDGVYKPPETGVRGRVDIALVPQDPLREDKLVGEDPTGIEDAVAVGIFEEDDAAELLLGQLSAGQVSAGALGDIEPAPVVEGGKQRVLDHRRAPPPFHPPSRPTP